MANLSTIAKVIARNDPEAYRQAQKACEPMLVNTGLIPRIHQAIRDQYPELDRTDESIVFAISVYQTYAPATMLDKGLARCPNGVRQQMCAVMGWNDAPVCNYYMDLGRAYQKVPSYRDKVSAVLLGFQQFSIKSAQGELF